MFSGIVEAVSQVKEIKASGTNREFTILNPFREELYIDQSINHNGVCLTVTELLDDSYKVTAILETLERSNLSEIREGSYINLERSLKADSRIDGHFVQGHVDCIAPIASIRDLDGSHEFKIYLDESRMLYIVEKGSISVNGISLTVSSVSNDGFSVSVIPYTFDNTNLKVLKEGDTVNLEFDCLGKYAINYLKKIKP